MTDRQTDGFDQIDPFERQLVRDVQAWTDQAVAPPDTATLARVARSGVRSRFRPAPSGGRGPLLVTIALAAAVLIGSLALRATPTATGQATLPPGASLSVSSTDSGNVGPSLPPLATGLTNGPSATPGIHPTPTPTGLAVPSSTPRPPKVTPRPDPGPTDAPHPTWTPVPTFTAVLKFVDQCYYAGDGTEQVFVWIEWRSPVRITEIWLWIDGQLKGVTWFASGSGIEGEYESRHSTTYSFEVGTTHSFSAQFKSSEGWVTGQIESAPYTVQQGDPCPA